MKHQSAQKQDAIFLLLTVKQAAARLQLGTNRVYTLVAAGTIPSVKVGKSIRVPVTALERWIEDQTDA